MNNRGNLFTFYFSISKGEMEFEIGWVWIALFVALMVWGLS